MTLEELYEKAVEAWGERAQLLKTVEEAGELQKAIARYLLKTGKYLSEDTHPEFDTWEVGALLVDLMEEVADVEIMIGQIKAAFSWHADLYELCRMEKELNLRRLLAVEGSA